MTDRVNVDPTCDNAGCERPPSANARALGKFIEYALTKPAVRFVTYSDLIGWMQARAWAAALLCLHCPLCVGGGPPRPVAAVVVGGAAGGREWRRSAACVRHCPPPINTSASALPASTAAAL